MTQQWNQPPRRGFVPNSCQESRNCFEHQWLHLFLKGLELDKHLRLSIYCSGFSCKWAVSSIFYLEHNTLPQQGKSVTHHTQTRRMTWLFSQAPNGPSSWGNNALVGKALKCPFLGRTDCDAMLNQKFYWSTNSPGANGHTNHWGRVYTYRHILARLCCIQTWSATFRGPQYVHCRIRCSTLLSQHIKRCVWHTASAQSRLVLGANVIDMPSNIVF